MAQLKSLQGSRLAKLDKPGDCTLQSLGSPGETRILTLGRGGGEVVPRSQMPHVALIKLLLDQCLGGTSPRASGPALARHGDPGHVPRLGQTQTTYRPHPS